MPLKAAPASTSFGYRDTAAQSAILKPDFDKLAFELDRDNESMPFLMKEFTSFDCQDQTYKYSSIAPLPLQVYSTLGYAAGDTSIVVDNADYIPRLAVLFNRRTLERMLVLTSTPSTDTIVVTRGWGSTAAAINANDTLYIIGDAYSEGSEMSDIITTNPTVYTNYTATQRTACGMTGHAMRAVLWTGKDYPQKLREALLRHKAKINQKLLWGSPVAPSTNYDQTQSGYVSGINNDSTAAVSDVGGLHYWLNANAPDANKKDFSAGNTLDENINWFQQLFDRGGKTRMIFGCQKYIWDWSRILKDFGQVELRSDLKEALNLDVTRVKIGGGCAIDFVMDKSLDPGDVGSASTGGWAFALDFTEKEGAPMYGKRVETENRKILISRGGDGEAEEFYTEFGFKLRTFDRHGFAWGI